MNQKETIWEMVSLLQNKLDGNEKQIDASFSRW